MRLQNIELLRFVAALGVVFFHTVGGLISRGFDMGLLSSMYSLGARGVDVFFVISGFVLYRGVLNSRRSPREFLFARLKRIVPSYWILTALAIIFSLVLSRYSLQQSLRAPDLGWVIASFTFTSEISGNSSPVLYQGWSLEYEMLFYIVLAASLFIPNRLLVALLPATLLTALVIAAGMNPQMLEFVAGMAVALATNRKVRPLLGSILAIIGLVLMCIGHASEAEHSSLTHLTQVGAVALVTGLVIMPQAKLAITGLLGSASYPVYLIQWFTIPVALAFLAAPLEPNAAHGVLILLTVLLATQFAGMAFDRFVDQPLAKAINRHTS